MSDYTDIRTQIEELVGDGGLATYTAAMLDAGLSMALTRYAQVVERVETKTFKLVGGGIFALSLSGWGSGLEGVAYVHWPAAATLPGTTGENKILDWWAYRKPDGYFYLDVQVDGVTLPMLDDYILVTGIGAHSIDGFTYNGVLGTSTSVPRIHWGLLELGAAGYAMRTRQAGLAIQGGGPDFTTAYHVDVLPELADGLIREFEAELAKLADKRLERPPWGYPERKRMRRILADGKP